MKEGKISIKSVIVTVIILLVGVLSVLMVTTVRTYMTGASAGAEPKNVLATPGEDGKSGVISWTTDKSVQAVVEYGANAASLLLRAPEAEATTDHRITITPLKANQNYFFRIRVGEEIYDNGGIPYSFKTKAAAEEPTVIPTPAVPTTSLLPTSQATGSGSSQCVSGVDYNKDGVANSIDYLKCLKDGPGTVSAPVPTSASQSATPASGCKSGVDYDNNGTINSLDMIKCLQTKK